MYQKIPNMYTFSLKIFKHSQFFQQKYINVANFNNIMHVLLIVNISKILYIAINYCSKLSIDYNVFRFTMLLLEPGEIFFEDYSVQMRRLDARFLENKNWMEGRLKLCSKSLVFANKDINQPLIKIQLKETTFVEQCTSSNNIAR